MAHAAFAGLEAGTGISSAVLTLLDGVRAADGTIRHHGDGDAAGSAIFADLAERVGALPWPLRNSASSGVPEELVLDELLATLARVGQA